MDAEKKAREWDTRTDIESSTGESYSRIYQKIEFYEHRHYRQYLPTQGSTHKEFLRQFDAWLENVTSDDDKRLLFELAPQITFYGREEFVKLYQVALHGPITRWLIDLVNLRFDDPNLQQTLDRELSSHTWYCPITDSMRISDFCHANNLGGIDFRPEFRSMAEFGDPQRIEAYMRTNRLKRIVLLEDFVGAGTQVESALKLASTLAPVLVCPLIICPAGSSRTSDYVNACTNATYIPVLELPQNEFITGNSVHPLDSFEYKIQALLRRTYGLVTAGNLASRPYTPFGFPVPHGTGAKIVMYTNTPANTLPIIQHESITWQPLFKRSARIR